jgi:hypothetical protein
MAERLAYLELKLYKACYTFTPCIEDWQVVNWADNVNVIAVQPI